MKLRVRPMVVDCRAKKVSCSSGFSGPGAGMRERHGGDEALCAVGKGRSDALTGPRSYTRAMNQLPRITVDPEVMGGRPCIRGIRMTVGTIVGLLAAGHTPEDVLKFYPYLEAGDIAEALAYAAWRSDEFEVAVAR